MALIGSLVVNLKANTAEFSKGLNRAAGIANSFAKSIKSVFTGITGIGTAVSAAGLGLLVKQQFEAIDATGNLAERLGIATEALTGLQHAANLADVSAESFEKGLSIMSTKLGEATGGSRAAQQAFEKVGLNFKELSTLPLDQAFLRVSDSIASMTNANDKAAASADIFGAKNKEIILLLNKGSAAIKAAMEDAKALGLTFTELDLAKIEEADISMKRMTAAVSAAARQVAVELTPAIGIVANTIANFVKWLRANSETIKEWGRSIFNAAKYVAEIIIVVKAFQKAIELVARAQKAWAVAQALVLSLSGPKGWITLAAGAGIAAGAIWGIEKAWAGVKSAAEGATSSMSKASDTAQIAAAKVKLGKLQSLRAEEQAEAKKTGNLGMVRGFTLEHLAKTNLQIAEQEKFIARLEKGAEAAKGKMAGLGQISLRGIAQQIPFIDTAMKGLTTTVEAFKKAFTLQGELQAFNDELKKGIATVGMSSEQIKLWELQQKGVPPAVLQATQALMKQKAAVDDAAKVFADTRTPVEKFQKEMARLQELEASGAFEKLGGRETFERARDELFGRTASELGADELTPREVKLPTAALAGSSEAISAINRFQSQGASDPQNRLAMLAKQQADTQKQMLVKLEQLYEQARGGGQIVNF